MSFFTGGAHCCSDTSVVTSNRDGATWQTVDVGEFNGYPMLADDLNGDGLYEFGLPDNAFFYAFGCYACSAAPLQVLALENGEVKDVSAEPRFRPAHSAWLSEMIESVPDEEPTGSLPAMWPRRSGSAKARRLGTSCSNIMTTRLTGGSKSVIGRPTRAAIVRSRPSKSASPKRSNACLTKAAIR